MASTTEPKEKSPERAHEPTEADQQKAGALVDDADQLVSEVLTPGRWPQARTVQRFLEEGRLERLLSLYSQAMWLDPSEPAYPWNLSSVLRRLDQNELAIAFLIRAIHVGERLGEDDFCGPDAYLALAETALNGGEHELAIVAIARARELGEGRDDVGTYTERLWAEMNPDTGHDTPARSLLRLLESVAR